MTQNLIKRTIHWLLLITVIVFLISGFGITEFRAVEALTFGLLTKVLAFKIHSILWMPFIILLGLHLLLVYLRHLKLKKEKGEVASH